MGVRQREQETVEKGTRSAPAGAARERARRPGETLERYVRGTPDLDWMDERSHPLDGEPVIVTYEEQGVVRHLRTCWLRGAGWREPWLRGRKLYWVHDPPL